MKIDDDVPLPRRKVKIKGERKYPFHRMEVGQSVWFEDQPDGSQSKPAQAAYVYGHKHGMKFTARPENGGVRVWRKA